MLFISWNINGIARRFDEVKRLAADYSPDFLCLQKVRSHEDCDSLAADGYRLLLAPLDRGDWSGVAVYVSQESGIMPGRIETRMSSIPNTTHASADLNPQDPISHGGNVTISTR